MLHLLIVEDDPTISSGLQYFLEQESYGVTVCLTCTDALRQIAAQPFDLALLDLSLPDGSGYEVCRSLRQSGDTAILFVTACDDEISAVRALDMGADDYVTKPFRMRELLSRIKSVLRRYGKGAVSSHTCSFGDVVIHPAQAKIYKAGEEILLTALEYRLLLAFANSEGRVLTRAQLLESIWDVSGDFVNDNTLTVYIKRLRDKLEDDPQRPQLIRTVRGLGYQMGGSHAAQ